MRQKARRRPYRGVQHASMASINEALIAAYKKDDPTQPKGQTAHVEALKTDSAEPKE